VAQDLGLSLTFQATPKQISNYSFTGSAVKQVEQLGAMGRVNAYVDDKALVVKDFNAPLAKRTRELNLDTGMIGIPEFTGDRRATQFTKGSKFLYPEQKVAKLKSFESRLRQNLDKLSYDVTGFKPFRNHCISF